MKTTKKEIQRVLRSMNVPAIHKIAHLNGVDTKDKKKLCEFIRQYAPSDSKAYQLSYGRTFINDLRKLNGKINQPIGNAIRFSKQQVKEGYSSYSKVLVEGNRNYYWCSPVYGHSDYNKSIAFENTAANKKKAEIINNYLTKHFKL